MDLTYFKRYRMEIDLGGRDLSRPPPAGYHFLPWEESLLDAFAEAKYLSFRDEIDANVFPCLAELAGCRRLMAEIVRKPGFLPGATWLAVYSPAAEPAASIAAPCRGCATSRAGRDPEPRHRPRASRLRPGHESAVSRAGRVSPGRRPSRVSRSDRPEPGRHPALPAGRIRHRQDRLQGRRGGVLPVTQSILSHTYPNGLVLVAEPMDVAAIGGVHVSGAGRLRPRSGRSRRPEQLHLRDGAARRRPARQPPVHPRSGQPGRGAERIGLQRPHQLQRRHAGREPARRRWRSTPTCCGARTCPTDQLEAGRLVMLQELRAVEDEPAQKVMIELRRRHYPEPWGRPAARRTGGPGGHRPSTTSARIFQPMLSSQRHDPRRGRAIRLAAAEGPGGRAVGRLAAGRTPTRSTSRPPPAGTSTCRTTRSQTQIGIAYASVPYRASRLLPGLGRGGRAERRHERPAVHRGPRAPRPVLQRLRHATTRCATAAPCSATPAPAPSGPRKRWT